MRYFPGYKLRAPLILYIRNAHPGVSLHRPTFIDISTHRIVRNDGYQEAVLGILRRVTERPMDFNDFLQHGYILTVVQVDAGTYPDRRHSATGIRNQIPHQIDVCRAKSET